MIRTEAPERRYAILAEGWFAKQSAKTAHGLIRYGRDKVACVIDSTLTGKRVSDVLPDLGRDAPIVGTLDEVLELSPTSRSSAASTSVSHQSSLENLSGTCASRPKTSRSSQGRASGWGLRSRSRSAPIAPSAR